mmetsp:Transcript_22092/g.30938  ORF Transcript_22092/g.30938 Transcript_22092/m.30938 type:complete len:140 (-) Transcript_22092:138-557(-)
MALTSSSAPLFRRPLLLAFSLGSLASGINEPRVSRDIFDIGEDEEGEGKSWDSDLDSEDYDDFEWQELMEELKSDIRSKMKEFSVFIGKSLGPRILAGAMTAVGFSFHMAFPYHVRLRPARETNGIRKFLSLFADSYIL